MFRKSTVILDTNGEDIMDKVYGYARCSTNETKQNIDRQRRELVKGGVPIENIFWEYDHGTNDDRIELNRLMNTVESGDTIVTVEVSRLARSTQKLCEIIKNIQEKQLRLLICNSITFDCRPGRDTDVMTKGMIQMWGVFSELEGEIIRQRIKSGMANAKAKGKKIGHPATTRDSIPSLFYKKYPLYKNGNINITDLAHLCECSRTTVYKYIKIIEEQTKPIGA